MQAFPSGWDEVLNELFGEKLLKSSDNLRNGKKEL
jgi:hypothetical protein